MTNKLTYEDIGFNNPLTELSEELKIEIPIGMVGQEIINLNFNCGFMYKSEAISSFFICGAIGSGKSELLKTILLNGSRKYCPKDLRFWIFDPKGHIVKDEKDSLCKIPHVENIYSLRLGRDVLGFWESLAFEGNRRYDLFEKFWSYSKDGLYTISQYNSFIKENPQLGYPLHRIIVMIDNFDNFFAGLNERDERDNNIIHAISHILHFAKVGIHFVCTCGDEIYDIMQRRLFNSLIGSISDGIALKHHSSERLEGTWFSEAFTNDILGSLDIGEGYLSCNYKEGLKFRIAYHDGEMEKYINDIIKTHTK